MKRVLSVLFVMVMMLGLAQPAIVKAELLTHPVCADTVNFGDDVCVVTTDKVAYSGNFELSVDGENWTTYLGNAISVAYSPWGNVLLKAGHPTRVVEDHRYIVANDLANVYSRVEVYFYPAWGASANPERVFNHIQSSTAYTEVFGPATVNDAEVKRGSVFEAFHDNELVGRSVVLQDGLLRYTKLFGSVGDVPGYHEGDPIELRIDGKTARWSSQFTWTDDKALHAIEVRLDSPKIISIEPEHPKPGEIVTLTGENLYPEAFGEVLSSSRIWFQPEGEPLASTLLLSNPATYISWTESTIVFKLPDNLPLGKPIDISVLRGNANLAGRMMSSAYTYYVGLTIYLPVLLQTK